MKISRNIKTLLRPIIDRYFGVIRNARRAYSQEGEDIVVSRLFSGQPNGLYVEVGCHHPYRYSNTYLLYEKGWRGVCIDPLPGTKKLFNAVRPRDQVYEVGISQSNSTLTYFMFNEPALNTFDGEIARNRDGVNGDKIIEQRIVEVVPLSQILENIKFEGVIDLMSIDVEGYDLDVLRSNNWDKYRPTVIIVECLALNMREILKDPIYLFLEEKNYFAYAKTGYSVIFKSEQ